MLTFKHKHVKQNVQICVIFISRLSSSTFTFVFSSAHMKDSRAPSSGQLCCCLFFFFLTAYTHFQNFVSFLFQNFTHKSKTCTNKMSRISCTAFKISQAFAKTFLIYSEIFELLFFKLVMQVILCSHLLTNSSNEYKLKCKLSI